MRATTILAACLAAALFSCPAPAQDAGQGDRAQRQRQRMSPEDAKAIWQLQAQGVARSLELSDDAASQLATAYVGARQKAAEATGRGGRGGRGGQGGAAGGPPPEGERGARGGRGGRGGGGFGVSPAVAEQREALAAGLADILTEEQLKKAMPVLGSFNRSWDAMVGAVKEMDLGESKTFAALKPIQRYIGTMSKAREAGDMQSMRETMRDARTSLTESLGEILDEEQMEQLTQTWRGRGGRGGSGGPGIGARLMQYDDNGDGKIQKSELPEGEGLEEIFDRLDRNGDGVLEGDELRGGRGGRGGGGGGNDA